MSGALVQDGYCTVSSECLCLCCLYAKRLLCWDHFSCAVISNSIVLPLCEETSLLGPLFLCRHQ